MVQGSFAALAGRQLQPCLWLVQGRKGAGGRQGLAWLVNGPGWDLAQAGPWQGAGLLPAGNRWAGEY